MTGAIDVNHRSRRRLKVMLQTEAAECALCCLAMVADFFGLETDLAHLRRRFPISLKGVTLAQLVDMAAALGLRPRPVRLEVDELHKLQTPCILHWNLNHFVVLKSVSRSAIVIHDPAFGEIKCAYAEVSRCFTGVALELSVEEKFKPRRETTPIDWKSITGRLVGLRKALTQVLALALVLEVFGLLLPLLLQIVMDEVLIDNDQQLLTLVGLGFLFLTTADAIVSGLRNWTIAYVGVRLNLAWTSNVFTHLLKLPESYFQKRHLGDVISRVGSINTIQQTLTTDFVDAILDGLMTVVTLAMMFVYSPVLAAFPIVGFSLYTVIRLLLYRSYRELTASQIVTTARQQSYLIESVRGVQTIRQFHKGSHYAVRYFNAATEVANRNLRIQRLNAFFGVGSRLIFGFERVTVIWVGAWMAMQGKFTAGMLMAFASYSTQFSNRAANLIDYSIQLKMLKLQGERLADIVLSEPERNVDNGYVGPAPAPSLKARNVGYRYALGEPWILRACSFEIAPGESVAIVGPSGCGKTTLAKIILGMLDPQEGALLVGGIELCTLGKARYREIVASVMQDDTLFAGSIADNICFFDPDARQDGIEGVANLVCIHSDIVRMPMGYHTLVGDMGSSLSGGQKQRILLARALYRKPAIIVLDEATSHLDVGTEKLVNKAVRNLNITRIIVSHRPDTIASADKIIRLERGRIRRNAADAAGPLDVAQYQEVQQGTT
jgi:ATP-binding cassette, subfamily B, bacterial CvaB/MchF/RaxB